MSYSYTPKINAHIQNSDLLKEGTFIWVFHANKVPPHIAISCDNNFFSVKSNGLDFNLSVSMVFNIIRRKSIPTLFIQLSDLNLQDVQNVFSKYDKIPEHASCLEPINKLLSPNNNFQSVGELLNSQGIKDSIKTIFSANIDDSFVGIPAYGDKEIKDRIEYLRNVKG